MYSVFGNAAYACSKIPIYVYEDDIVSVEIFSDADFDKDHSAGSNLADMFSIPDTTEFGSQPIKKEHHLTLKHAPDSASTHRFTIKLIKRSGDELVSTTVPVKVGK